MTGGGIMDLLPRRTADGKASLHYITDAEARHLRTRNPTGENPKRRTYRGPGGLPRLDDGDGSDGSSGGMGGTEGGGMSGGLGAGGSLGGGMGLGDGLGGGMSGLGGFGHESSQAGGFADALGGGFGMHEAGQEVGDPASLGGGMFGNGLSGLLGGLLGAGAKAGLGLTGIPGLGLAMEAGKSMAGVGTPGGLMGAIGSTIGALGGPLGSIAGGLVGNALGSTLGAHGTQEGGMGGTASNAGSGAGGIGGLAAFSSGPSQHGAQIGTAGIAGQPVAVYAADPNAGSTTPAASQQGIPSSMNLLGGGIGPLLAGAALARGSQQDQQQLARDTAATFPGARPGVGVQSSVQPVGLDAYRGLGYARGGTVRHDGHRDHQGGRDARSGFVHSATPGRADQVTSTVAHGSYVVPADVVSGMGQGNSLAGSKALASGLPTGLPGYARGGSVPVRLSGGEHVVTPGQVAAMGGGSHQAGAQRLDRLVRQVRERTAAMAASMPGPK